MCALARCVHVCVCVCVLLHTCITNVIRTIICLYSFTTGTPFIVQKAIIQKAPCEDFNIKGKVRFRLTAMIVQMDVLVSKKEYPMLDKTMASSMFQVHNLKLSQKH